MSNQVKTMQMEWEDGSFVIDGKVMSQIDFKIDPYDVSIPLYDGGNEVETCYSKETNTPVLIRAYLADMEREHSYHLGSVHGYLLKEFEAIGDAIRELDEINADLPVMAADYFASKGCALSDIMDETVFLMENFVVISKFQNFGFEKILLNNLCDMVRVMYGYTFDTIVTIAFPEDFDRDKDEILGEKHQEAIKFYESHGYQKIKPNSCFMKKSNFQYK